MVPPNNLGPDLAGKSVNETSYRGMIGSLMYLTTTRYLKGTLTLGLYYPKCLGFDLKGYSDSDYAGCNMDRKSTSVTDIELTAHMIAINNRRDAVSPPPLVAKPKKGKSQTVALTLPKSQGPEASGALFKKRKKPVSKRPPTTTKESPPKPTEGSE
ncbi:hypothetical protein Tco_0800401 [Tanacetum coccineum]|uniref:Uncharacterized protein n=1 Tax=Tanacetum coccineum TaxID=301880 RepID=A0ABQ4ZSZ5_9ASTR